MPIFRRATSHPTVNVVSARKRAANATFAGSPLRRVSRSAEAPPPPLQFLRDDLFRPRLGRQRPLFSVMLRPHPPAHACQQLLPERLLAQAPATPDRLERLVLPRPAPD